MAEVGQREGAQPEKRMTAHEIIGLVNNLDYAITQMLAWMSPGGACCEPPTRLYGYCTHPPCIARHERYAAEFAREAAHLAKALQAIAEQQATT